MSHISPESTANLLEITALLSAITERLGRIDVPLNDEVLLTYIVDVLQLSNRAIIHLAGIEPPKG